MFNELKTALGGMAPAGGTLAITKIGDLLGIALNVLLGSAVGIGSLGVVLSGIKYVMSKGDPKAKAEAQHALTYSIVAIVLGLGAFAVKAIIFGLLGVTSTDLTNELPSF
ncbi:MAG: hypothetical protein UX44_C0007G0012 [candidate division WWE3 bacterium GW2011_GWA1_46_21]|uniref:Uncharacterized protein n=3 Tax=Katanobacteria TaxID=422282 RepID=A0A0G1RMK4_UNCKA|nr:MAG: hypothetical protein UX44_C0007G0012 [candidate division WWE3 bacterium GW2011_GWA1_46_21]KKU50801.1 MAG: hypothetical protein UX73_C0014G0008 [candidate division WWE3 bacterium GW2011_GWC1_47_10]KKU57579.1 MAG: hypothetical protein UX79_C0008G0013 [candidate division WWE3 bacterium GW2011_GWB1_47_11]